MTFEPMNLPFETNALEPYISARTMTFHHDKHYKKYIETLNVLMAKSVSFVLKNKIKKVPFSRAKSK